MLVQCWLVAATAQESAIAVPSMVKEGTAEELLYADFESVFPRHPWRVEHPQGAADVDWGRTSYRASAGDFSIYCAGMGTAAPGDGGPAPANTASWAIVGPYDLSDTETATLTFDLWLQTEQLKDVFMWLVSTDGETFNGSATSTDTDGWQTVTTDLSSWGTAGSVIGEERVWLAFVYQSDHNNLFEGAYVDEVRLTVDHGEPAGQGYTYTSNADFALGEMVGLETTTDRLELTSDWDALPYIWVPNSATGTVSKLATDTGDELARYATGPETDVDPAVAAVDFDGACWVGNRGAGTVIKIGLEENGGCVDRDGDGVIETSGDTNRDGDIEGSELLDWGDDECVLVEISLVAGSVGTHVPGEDHDNYELNNLQAVAIDAEGNVWAGVQDDNLLYLLDGSTGEVLDQVDLTDENTYPTATVVDGEGTLWTSSWPDFWVLAIDPSTTDTTRVDLTHGSSGLAIDDDGKLFVTGFEASAFSRIDITDKTVDWVQVAGWQAQGAAVTDDGHLWVASVGGEIVSRYNRQGSYLVGVPLSGGPTGVAVDEAGKIWVTRSLTDAVTRIDPAFASPDLEKVVVGSGGHDATGDLTGIVARNLTARFGTWTVVYDSENPGTPWGLLTWKSAQPEGTTIAVRVRSSDDEDSWSGWETALKGEDLLDTPPGRYLQIQASLRQLSGDDLPKLNELTVTPAAIQSPPEASFTWFPQDPAVGDEVQFTDTSTGAPTGWAWDFGDGATSSDQNPTHTFTAERDHDVKLTVTNDGGSDSITVTVTIGPGAGCTVSCSAAAPMTGELDQPVAFLADATAVGCSGDLDYSWSFGDGATSTEQNPSYSYSATGTRRWEMTAAVGSTNCVRSADITISGDGPSECTSTYWVPVVSRADGANGSLWRTDLGLLGIGGDSSAVELRMHGNAAILTRTVTVASSAMVNLVDVVGWMSPGFSGSGALEVCSDGPLTVTTRTYNLLPDDHACFPKGTFGQFLAGFPSDAGLSAGQLAWLAQLRESESFRSNIGLVNTGSETATVEIGLYDATGAELEVFQIELEPSRWHQENRPLLRRAGRSDLDAASASVRVVTGNGVIAYASVIDNLTNDATTVPMRR
jgi:PKD repeat protein/streptogramin lyase